jgi:hypothetical protein
MTTAGMTRSSTALPATPDGWAAPHLDAIGSDRARLTRLADFLDNAIRIPGLGVRVGADAALNLIPGIGTLGAKALAGYIVLEARRLGVPPATLARMLAHIGLDFVISAIPVLGWVGDIFFRANARNIALIHEHLDRRERVLRQGGVI